MNEKIQQLAENVRSDKRLMLIVILGLIGIVLLTFSEIKPKKNASDESRTETTDICAYEEKLEKRLSELIMSIDGAGRTRVMITLASGDESVYATEDKGNDKSYERSYVVVKQNGSEEGILLKVTEPEIRGVAVVCEGAGSAAVRQEIINTVTAVLNVGTNRVSISKMKISDGG